jgi:hypothetical protein
MTKLNTKASASTGYQADQSGLNQAHNLSLLALTIQADALKKRSIQSDASAWIGLIVDNYDHMLALMQQDPQEAGQPLFRLHDGAFTRNRVLRLLSSRLTHCGINATAYKGHSFRKWAANEAYKQHLSHEQIQALGRWTSEAVNRYYRRDSYRLFALVKQFITGKSLPLATRP